MFLNKTNFSSTSQKPSELQRKWRSKFETLPHCISLMKHISIPVYSSYNKLGLFLDINVLKLQNTKSRALDKITEKTICSQHFRIIDSKIIRLVFVSLIDIDYIKTTFSAKINKQHFKRVGLLHICSANLDYALKVYYFAVLN